MAAGPYRSKGGWYHIVWTRRGKQTKEALKTKNMQTARKRKSELEAKFFSGEHDPFEKKWYERQTQSLVTLPMAAAEYIRFKAAQKGRKGWKTEQTYDSHKRVIELFSDSCGNTPVSSIEREHIEKFLHRKEIKSDHTRVSYKARIDAFLNWCREQGYIKNVPQVEVNAPQRQVKVYVSDKMLKKIFTRMEELVDIDPALRFNSSRAGFTHDTAWYADWCRVAVGTGLRPGELNAIRIDDISDSDIYVGKSFRTKTNTARKVPIEDPIARGVIERYTDEKVRKSDPVLSKSDKLFGRTRMKGLNRDLKQACKDVRSPVILTSRELRHLFAIRYLIRNRDNDLGLVRLMQILGHSKLSTTQIYLNYIPHNNQL